MHVMSWPHHSCSQDDFIGCRWDSVSTWSWLRLCLSGAA